MDATSLPTPDDKDTHTIGRKSERRPRIELITRGERRRIWTPEQKREIVGESLQPGTTPTAVARKHAISSGLLVHVAAAGHGCPRRSGGTVIAELCAG